MLISLCEEPHVMHATCQAIHNIEHCELCPLASPALAGEVRGAAGTLAGPSSTGRCLMTTDPLALRRPDWDRRRSERSHTQPERAATVLSELASAAEPGDRLGSKAELRAACGVSVGTFNEALRIAQTRGLVTVRPGPGGGLFASQQSAMVRLGNSMLALDDEAASVAEAVRLRDALDPLLVEDALEHVSAHGIAA